ncbi:PAS domain-containing protein [Aquimarina litoralis]|uniref:PAS domain-containing protein n=1 Tax=Aquimarina litoralis TaxID=584605 RepID=UPI001C572154|nr:PAS domain S-box protein [Aquimarina litoralis]MBW1294326.1 PAS domain S-box protein [Aquimarina litoralis]
MAYSEETTSRDYTHFPENYLRQELFEIVKKDEKIFDFIQDNALDGIWFWDLKDPKTEWMNDNRFWINLGYDHNDIPNLKTAWKELINQEDLEKALENLDKHLNEPDYPYDQVIRYTNKSGSTVWIRSQGMAIRDHNGKPMRMIGIHTDITNLKETEEELQKQVEKYEDVIESTNSGSWEWNLRTGKVVFDEKWANIVGYSLSELQPISLNTWVNFMHPSDHIKSTKLLQQHYEKLVPYYECETRLKHKNGEWIWALIKGKIISWDNEGNPELLVGTQVDITENKKALEKNRLFVSQAPSAMAMFDNNMRYLAASSRWFEDYDIVGQNIIGKTQFEVFPEMKEKWEEIYNKCLKGNVLTKDEDCLKRKEGCLQWISWELRPWYNKEGKVGGLLKHTSDISKLKQAETLSEERKVFLEVILDSLDVGVVSCDDRGLLTLFNETAKKWHGLQARPISPSELSTYYGLCKPDGITPLKEEEIPLLQALKGRQVLNEEIVITSKNEKKRQVVTNGSQLLGINGEIKGAVVAMHDVTDRKIAEEKLKISEQAFRGNFESAATGMAIIGLDGRWVEVNDAVCNMIGYPKEELTQMTFQDITHPEDLNKDLGLLNELLNGKISYYHLEKRYFHKNGREVHAILSVSLVRDKNKDPLYFISQIANISQRVNALKKLKEAQKKLENILESENDLVITATDVSGVITIFNKGAENLLGYSRDELLLKENISKLFVNETIAKDSLKTDVFSQLIKSAENEKYFTTEWNLVTKNEKLVLMLLTLVPLKEEEDVIGYLCIAMNISNIKATEKKLTSNFGNTINENMEITNFLNLISGNLKSQAIKFEILLETIRDLSKVIDNNFYD